jgi:hypothetical protein
MEPAWATWSPFDTYRAGEPWSRECSTLSLLVSRIGAHDEHNAPAANDLAVFADAFDAGTDLHNGNNPNLSKIAKYFSIRSLT